MCFSQRNLGQDEKYPHGQGCDQRIREKIIL